MTDGAPIDEPGSDAATIQRRRPMVRRALEWAAVVVGALMIAYVIQLTSLQAFRIPSDSMVPTLATGDRVLVNKWSYRLHDVERGDVVVFSRPPELTDTRIDDVIKRVIGLPGERISIAEGHVWVDGRRLEEPYLPGDVVTLPTGPLACPPAHPCEVPEGSIWVMGDNRELSQDSRWFGPIPVSTVVGRAAARIWPLGRLGQL